MRVVIVGLGIQGRKRQAIAGRDVVATVDPVAPEATHRRLEDVPRSSYDAALVCTPDAAKLALVRELLSHQKHVLVEKPLVGSEAQLRELEAMARAAGVACYTAYNHRFEPHLARLKARLDAGTLGTLYLVRGFYGNGTARDVQRSPWRDQGLGVLADLGSHLLDTVHFLLGEPAGPFELWSASRMENRAWDHVAFGARGTPLIELEATLLSWRNTFTLDVIGERGSAHIACLCKWGPSTLTLRTRVLPSGRPAEEIETLTCADPTWALEYDHFKTRCASGGTNLAHDRWIASVLAALTAAVPEPAIVA